MDFNLIEKWFEREAVELEGRVYIFPHGAQIIKRWIRENKPEPCKPLGFVPARDPEAKCPDCGGQWLYNNLYDKCYTCARNIDPDNPKSKVYDEPRPEQKA